VQTGDAFARLGAPAGVSVSADIAEIAAETDLIPTTAQIFSAVWTTQLTEAYAALHAVPTAAQALFEIRSMFCEKSVSGTTLTINKIDGVTAAETFTLNDASAPTALTRAT
jgi:hypothetical protein